MIWNCVSNFCANLITHVNSIKKSNKSFDNVRFDKKVNTLTKKFKLSNSKFMLPTIKISNCSSIKYGNLHFEAITTIINCLLKLRKI